jgi:hypothetical protein
MVNIPICVDLTRKGTKKIAHLQIFFHFLIFSFTIFSFIGLFIIFGAQARVTHPRPLRTMQERYTNDE